MLIKRTINFVLNGEPGSTDAKLRLRAKWGDPQIIATFNVGYRVERDKWMGAASRVKNNTTHGKKKVAAATINRAIADLEQTIDNVFNNFERDQHTPSAEELRQAVRLVQGKITPDQIQKVTIFDRMVQFMREMGTLNGWSIATHQKFKTLSKHLYEFDPSLTFAACDQKKLTRYVEFMRINKKLRDSSVAKDLSLLKWFLRWAVDQGYCNEVAFEKFKPKMKTVSPRIVFLEWEELQIVYNYPFSEQQEHLAKVRDVFCFCCFTSLRYSDVANLRRFSVNDTYISLTSVKTSDALKIELNKYSRAILDKYKNEEYPKDLALPVISNQKMNDALKEIGKLCELTTPIAKTYYRGDKRIDEVQPKYMLLSTHVARRTFICNALMMGIPSQIVMKWTGHSDYKAMKPYIDIADSAKADAMQLFNK